MKSVLLVTKLLRLDEMTSGLVNGSFSLPFKNDFLCTLYNTYKFEATITERAAGKLE